MIDTGLAQNIAPVIVEELTRATLTGDASAECRVLLNRIKAAKGRLGDADYIVANAEMRRAQARGDVAREIQELEALAAREAKRLGVDLSKPGWRFEPETGTFTRI